MRKFTFKMSSSSSLTIERIELLLKAAHLLEERERMTQDQGHKEPHIQRDCVQIYNHQDCQTGFSNDLKTGGGGKGNVYVRSLCLYLHFYV